MVNLEDISDKYQKNLIKFFSDERIMDYIYTEQYGEEEYEKHRAEYAKQYKEVLRNTVFVPYVTLEDLERFLATTEWNDNLAKDDLYAEERKLCQRLNAKKRNIIKQYTNQLLEEIHKIDPEITISDDKLLDINFKYNIVQIRAMVKAKLDSYRYGDEKSLIKWLSSYAKMRKIEKVIMTYKYAVDGKLIAETSSYFKHKRDVPHDKFYVSTMDDILAKENFVRQKIAGSSEKNCRYIYLPVLTYRNKQDYLTIAIHEFMHVSKEQIKKDEYCTGLITRKFSKDGKLYIINSESRNILQLIRWLWFIGKNKLKINDELFFQAYEGNVQLEEALHHWQVRKVAENIMEDGLDSLLYMPYNPELIDRDTSTYYGLFETLYRACHAHGIKLWRKNRAQGMNTHARRSDLKELDVYVEAGKKIIDSMDEKTEKYVRRMRVAESQAYSEDVDDDFDDR